MIKTSDIEKKIKDNLNPSHVEVVDLRGGDHIQAIIVSSNFEGKSMIEQHKLVYDIFTEEMKSNEIHALTLKTFTPSQWDEVKGSFNKHLGHSI